uniref:Uncharacterized protein n=1 Tax=Nelumbo nucifera TaxID=4432 RepID=A0A822Y4M7_NELNU|nr:TPA_asm: hypothetical protein HUJ06_028421 [Nelumbo nucifera]
MLLLISLFGSADAPRGEDNALPKHETSSEPLQSDTPKAIKKAEPQLRKCATNIGSRKLPLDVIKEIEPAMDSPTAQHSSNSMIDTEPRAETQLHHTNKIILKEISSSISASEVNRLLCSITIALLVVLSHLNIPLLSSGFVKSIITFRPLYLILLTDATIVFARILSLKQGCTENPKEEEQRSSEDGFDWIADVGKALEIVLVLQKAAAAAFLDCGVYVVLVVCGLLLVH